MSWLFFQMYSHRRNHDLLLWKCPPLALLHQCLMWLNLWSQKWTSVYANNLTEAKTQLRSIQPLGGNHGNFMSQVYCKLMWLCQVARIGLRTRQGCSLIAPVLRPLSDGGGVFLLSDLSVNEAVQASHEIACRFVLHATRVALSRSVQTHGFIHLPILAQLGSIRSVFLISSMVVFSNGLKFSIVAFTCSVELSHTNTELSRWDLCRNVQTYVFLWVHKQRSFSYM